MDAFNKFLELYRIGDYAGLLGLLISFVGFFLTIRAARKSKTASEKAEAAVQAVRADMNRNDTVESFASALILIEEIRRMHLAKNWLLLPDRYANLRKHLIVARTGNLHLDKNDQITLQGVITRTSSMERAIIEHLATDASVERVRVNRSISKDYDALQAIFLKVRNEIGKGVAHG